MCISTYLNNNVRNTGISQWVTPASNSDFSTTPDVLDLESAVDLLEVSFDLSSLGLVSLALKPNVRSGISNDIGKGDIGSIGQGSAGNILSESGINGRLAVLGTQNDDSLVEEPNEDFIC